MLEIIIFPIKLIYLFEKFCKAFSKNFCVMVNNFSLSLRFLLIFRIYTVRSELNLNKTDLLTLEIFWSNQKKLLKHINEIIQW